MVQRPFIAEMRSPSTWPGSNPSSSSRGVTGISDYPFSDSPVGPGCIVSSRPRTPAVRLRRQRPPLGHVRPRSPPGQPLPPLVNLHFCGTLTNLLTLHFSYVRRNSTISTCFRSGTRGGREKRRSVEVTCGNRAPTDHHHGFHQPSTRQRDRPRAPHVGLPVHEIPTATQCFLVTGNGWTDCEMPRPGW